MRKKLLIALFYLSQAGAADRIFLSNQINFTYANRDFIHANFPTLPKPLFWNSKYKTDFGMQLSYLRTIYHTHKSFSILFGSQFSRWSITPNSLYALGVGFELRWWMIHTKTFNPYLIYSIAGPTVLSRNNLGRSRLGGYFLFQDYFGLGMQIGAKHPFNLEVKAIHYSNGDLAVKNNGLQIPFAVSLGISF